MEMLGFVTRARGKCLPSLLHSLFRWYERQYMLDEGSHGDARIRHKSKG